jgi:putative ABC transport system permease protein
MKVPIIEGRGFTSGDRLKAPQVVVINQTMARRFWPNENPIGKRLNLGTDEAPDFCEIIGIVGDVKHFGPEAESKPQLYISHVQSPARWMSLIVRTVRNHLNLVSSVRAEVLALDAAQPVYDIQTLEKSVAQSLAPRRFAMLLLAIFAIVALALGAIGIYGVISYAVSKRTHEIGIRMALGARRQDVLGLVVRQGMKLALIGVGVGLTGALAITRVLQSLLFEVKPFDPLIFLLVTLSLAAVALFACWLPARRAAEVEPMEALRHE